MKNYIAFNTKGHQIGLIRAGSFSSAEKKAIKKHGIGTYVAEIEL